MAAGYDSFGVTDRGDVTDVKVEMTTGYEMALVLK